MIELDEHTTFEDGETTGILEVYKFEDQVVLVFHGPPGENGAVLDQMEALDLADAIMRAAFSDFTEEHYTVAIN
jgi:hypothetical protein